MESNSACTCDQCLLMQMRSTNPVERQQGWEAWYRRDAATVLAFIERRALQLLCMEHSEDILQDCFLIGFKNVSTGQYRDQGLSLCAYLIGIAKNRLREVVRLQQQKNVALGDAELEDHLGIDPIDSLYLDEVINLIREACTHRPHVHQRVVEGIYVEGKSSNEVAVELGKRAGNVRAIAHRTVYEIGQYLERQHSMRLSAEAIRACLEAL